LKKKKNFNNNVVKKKSDNQRKRNETIKALIRNNNVQLKPNTRPSIVSCVNNTMHSSCKINLSNEINGESSVNVTTICHQLVYQSNYRARKKGQPYLNINNSLSINDTVEYYIGSMDVLCIHCNAKHFPAENVSNKRNSFHDCCNHGAVYLKSLPQPP